MNTNSLILPGSAIGILGGGQLGRMTAMAARSYGYRVQVLDPDPACPARFVVDSCITAEFSDARAASGFARGCDVVTLDVEGIAPDALQAVAAFTHLRPAETVLRLIQDRIAQKEWLASHGFPVGPFAAARDLAQLQRGIAQLAGRCFVKRARGGYDGRGQAVVTQAEQAEQAEQAWCSLGEQPCVIEASLDLAHELSVLIARRPSGEQSTFPISQNDHVDGVLRFSVLPAPASVISAPLQQSIVTLANDLASTLQLEGLLAIELFLTTNGQLYINELAARPHNTFHTTERACCSSQFEQHVRAVCDLPLADTSLVRPGAIANLFGDLWLRRGDLPPATSPVSVDWSQALTVPTLRLHLYEKRTPRPRRKMGHLSALGDTSEQALSRVQQALQRLLEPAAPS